MTAVRRVGPNFKDWPRLLALIREAFSVMEGRIDPPSSVHRLTVEKMADDAAHGAVFVAEREDGLAGCIFCRPRGGALYLGKLAVRPNLQGQGIGHALVDAARAEAERLGLSALELEARVELWENHAAFAAMGFTRVAETSHPGFDRTTSITMRRCL